MSGIEGRLEIALMKLMDNMDVVMDSNNRLNQAFDKWSKTLTDLDERVKALENKPDFKKGLFLK